MAIWRVQAIQATPHLIYQEPRWLLIRSPMYRGQSLVPLKDSSSRGRIYRGTSCERTVPPGGPCLHSCMRHLLINRVKRCQSKRRVSILPRAASKYKIPMLPKLTAGPRPAYGGTTPRRVGQDESCIFRDTHPSKVLDIYLTIDIDT